VSDVGSWLTLIPFALALFSAFLLGLALASAILARHKLRKHVRGGRGPVVDDAAVRAILATGLLSVEDDERLDLDVIDEEERRFWSERWDEPEEV